MASLQTMIKARAQTPSPLQELRTIRRENLRDDIAMSQARVNNELRRLQIQQLQEEKEVNSKVNQAIADAFKGRGQPEPWMSPLGRQPTPEQSQAAAQNINNRLAENPQMIKDLRSVRDKLYSVPHDVAQQKAAKLDNIIGEYEQRNYFKRKSIEDERQATKTANLEAARAWYATPDPEKEARFDEFIQAHGITGIDNVGEMNVWARDLKAAAEDTDLTKAAGPAKPSDVNALLTRADKIRKQFDTEIARYYPEIRDSKGDLHVGPSYDMMRKRYSSEIDKAADSGKQFDPEVIFADVVSRHRYVQKPRSPWMQMDGLDDLNQDVFVPIDWFDKAKSQNRNLTEGQIAILYNMALTDKLKNQGEVSPETWNAFTKHGLAQ